MATSTIPNTLNDCTLPSVISTSPCRIIALGNLRVIYFTGIVWYSLVGMTIPSGSRPKTAINVTGVAWKSGSNLNARYVRFTLGTDGKVSNGLIWPYYNNSSTGGSTISSGSDIVVYANCILYEV